MAAADLDREQMQASSGGQTHRSVFVETLRRRVGKHARFTARVPPGRVQAVERPEMPVDVVTRGVVDLQAAQAFGPPSRARDVPCEAVRQERVATVQTQNGAGRLGAALFAPVSRWRVSQQRR